MEHASGNCCARALTYASKVNNSVQNTASVQSPDQDVIIDVDVVGGGSDDDLEFPPAMEIVKLDKDNNITDNEGEDGDDVDVDSDDDGDSGDGDDDDNGEMGADDETEIDATRAEDDPVGDMECDREPFISALRKSSVINGVAMPGTTKQAKVSTFADDTTAIL
ncbi:secreted acidic protein 1A-like [Liolophura sinensis]|uniref:secreted acidic protein 1A-like n=1 Tax=Liolophura sinensis TaxID=3198878 RepID=UPI0031596403